jgi:hypothetical protein
VTDLMRGVSLVAPAAAPRAPEAQANAQERVHRREDAEAEAEAQGSPSDAQHPGAERSSGAHRRESEGRAGRVRGGGSPREAEEEEEEEKSGPGCAGRESGARERRESGGACPVSGGASSVVVAGVLRPKKRGALCAPSRSAASRAGRRAAHLTRAPSMRWFLFLHYPSFSKPFIYFAAGGLVGEKPSARDFEWGDAIGEGAYSRVRPPTTIPPFSAQYKPDAHLSLPYKSGAHLSLSPYKSGAHLSSRTNSTGPVQPPCFQRAGAGSDGDGTICVYVAFEMCKRGRRRGAIRCWV